MSEQEVKLFPESVGNDTRGFKNKLSRYLGNKTQSFDALEIALNTYQMYDYLKRLGVENPNQVFVEFIEYSSESLGVAYEVIEQSFWTAQPLTEVELFKQSTLYNPQKQEKELKPQSNLNVNFNSLIDSVFKKFEEEGVQWKNYRQEGVVLSEKNPNGYQLDKIFQKVLQEVWDQAKAELEVQPAFHIEELRQAFSKFFYAPDQKNYNEEAKKKVLSTIGKSLVFKEKEIIKSDLSVQKLIFDSETSILKKYMRSIIERLLEKDKYINYLQYISKIPERASYNQLLLFLQIPAGKLLKESYEWTRLKRELKKEAQPYFILSTLEKVSIVNSETGEIAEPSIDQLNVESVPNYLPVFDFHDTFGAAVQVKVYNDYRKLFLAFQKGLDSRIVFSDECEEVGSSVKEGRRIILKSKMSESQTLRSLIHQSIYLNEVLLLDGNENREETIFKIESFSTLVLFYFGFEPYFNSFDFLTKIKWSKKPVPYMEKWLDELQKKSHDFIQKIEFYLEPKQTKKEDVLLLEEEISEAKRAEKLAIENTMTAVENEKEEKAGEQGLEMSELILKFRGQEQGSSEEEDE